MKQLLTKLFSKKNQSETPIPMPAAGQPRIERDSSRKRRNPWGLVIALVLVVGGIMGGQYVLSKQTPSNSSVKGITSPIGTSKSMEVNQSFSFAPYNAAKKISDKKIGFTITSVEKTSEIIIKGKRATAVSGRAFLIVNLKLTNTHNESLYMNTRNFIRVQPGNSEDNLAPDIHNDTVEIQPLSTKVTRVGVPVDANVSEFKIFVGELEKDKERTEIQISL